jgi:hypothetical protein
MPIGILHSGKQHGRATRGRNLFRLKEVGSSGLCAQTTTGNMQLRTQGVDSPPPRKYDLKSSRLWKPGNSINVEHVELKNNIGMYIFKTSHCECYHEI